MSKKISQQTKEIILKMQKNEITEHFIYNKLSSVEKNKNNKQVLANIAKDELHHYQIWKNYTGDDISPNSLLIWLYYLVSRILGTTFGIKLMEKGEKKAQIGYSRIIDEIPEANQILKDEERHENNLINLIKEEKLKYIGSIVLGLNDALVELTGALAGFTFALQKPALIAVAGLITGIAASFSMASSEYLSTKTQKDAQNPLKAAIYTGFAYFLTVLFLVLPYLILKNIYISLIWMLFNAMLVILAFTFYTTVAQDYPFKKRFVEMMSVSLGVAALTFIIGILVRKLFGFES